MISGQHKHHLQELAGIAGKTAAEPQQSHNTANANVLPEDVRDGHPGVQQFLATVVGDSGDKSGRFSNKTQLLGPRIVDRDFRRDWLRAGFDSAILDQALVNLPQDLRQILKGFRDVDAGLPHGLVLADGGLEVGVGRGTRVAELDLRLEHARAGANGPRDDRLGNGAILDGLNDTVLLHAANLTEKQEDLALGLGLVSQQMVDEGRSRVSVATDGNTLVDTVCVLRDDVVQLIGHTTGLGDVANGAVAVELGGDDVVHHTAGVANLEGARLDAANSGRPDDGDTLLLGSHQDFPCSLLLVSKFEISNQTTYSLRNPLGNDGNGFDLRALHQLHGGTVDGAGRREVDDGVDIRMFRHGFGDVLIDGKEGLVGAPVPVTVSVWHCTAGGRRSAHLTDELAAKGVDDTSNGGGGPLADEVEVEHALDSSGLHTAAPVNKNWRIAIGADILYEASCLVVEEGVGEGREHATGGVEASDVVVGRLQAIGHGTQGGGGHG